MTPTHPHTQYTPETHPDWAIEETLKRGGSWLSVSYVKANTFLYPQILAHAYDIARLVKQPVQDKAALILADWYEARGWKNWAERTRNGDYPADATALRTAMLKNGIDLI